MRTIWKFDLDEAEDQIISMPIDAHILSAGVQTRAVRPYFDATRTFAAIKEVICIWALVETNNAQEERGVSVRGTGHNCDNLKNEHFLGSVMLENGAFVFHVFVDRLF